MAMAACGEDEFGNLFADLHVKDVHALRGFGSLHWSLEDDTEISTDTSFKTAAPNHLSVACVDGCCVSVNPAQVELDASAVQCAFKKDNQADCGNISKHGTGIALPSKAVETDSDDDDLHIVLNQVQKSVNEGSADESEDGEDFVVLTGDEVATGQERREESFVPTEDSAQDKVAGGDKLGTSADGQVQIQKTSGVHPRICYGGQTFRRHYKYIRENGVGRVGAISSGNVRVANCKSSYLKSKRIGVGGGFTNFHRIAGGSGAARGFSSGPEYILPSNKTVFDVDIDAFKEKPWTHSNVDVSDYFNFELDESSWKKYCKQLAQFCLEITTQSKISVYEGGRIGQPAARDTQGGSVGRRSSADVQGQQFRESDAIFLVDVKEDNTFQSCSEGHQVDGGDACQVLDSDGLNKNVDLENKAEKERSSVERKTQASQKRSTAILREFSANVLQESGSAPVVSRPKTPSPATPPERLPTRGKRDTMVFARRRSSSSLNDGLQVGQEDCNSALHKRKENLQIAGHKKTSWEGQSSNAVSSKPIRENHLSRTDLKRGSAHAIAAQFSKKQRLDSSQANHGCRYASLLIRKLSRVRTSKAISDAQVGVESIQQGNRSSIDTTFGLPNGKLFNGPTCEHATQVAEKQLNPTISVDTKRSKRKCKANSIEVKDVLPGIPCEFAKEKSREKLKVKKSTKGHKGKERSKSKDKVHLPGCPKSKKGLRTNNPIQEIGNVSMISFISKDNNFYWEKVDKRNIEDENAEKTSTIYHCHETEERIEERSVSDKIDGHHIIARGEKECKESTLKRQIERSLSSDYAGTRSYDKLLENHAWNALKVLRGKKKDVKHMLMREMRLASSKAHLLANSTGEAHANVSKEVLVEKRNKFEDKQRASIYEQLHLESEPKSQELSNSGLANGQRRKKKHKRSHKPSCKYSKKLTPLADPEEQSNSPLYKHKNHGAATIVSGKIGSSLDEYGRSREAALKFRQTQPLSTKVDVTNGAGLGQRMWKMGKQFKQTMWHYQETKSFWAFSV